MKHMADKYPTPFLNGSETSSKRIGQRRARQPQLTAWTKVLGEAGLYTAQILLPSTNDRTPGVLLKWVPSVQIFHVERFLRGRKPLVGDETGNYDVLLG